MTTARGSRRKNQKPNLQPEQTRVVAGGKRNGGEKSENSDDAVAN